jgi:diaminopimelate epimerase
MRTYERGVENETLSCGTGAVATAITAAIKHQIKDAIILETLGGKLAVKFDEGFKNVFLCGEVKKVFEGTFEIN